MAIRTHIISIFKYQFPIQRRRTTRRKKLSIDDKIKIQKVLKNLENYLEKFSHRAFIFQILSWLRYQCFTQKSDKQLKNFLFKIT
jgi:hypothetical protein